MEAIKTVDSNPRPDLGGENVDLRRAMAKNPRSLNLGIQRFELVSTSLFCCWFDSRSGSRLLQEESGNLSSHVILARKAELAGPELQSLRKHIVKESILKSLGEQRNWEFQIGLSKGAEQLSQWTCCRWIQRIRGVLVGQRIWRRHYHILAERMLTRGCCFHVQYPDEGNLQERDVVVEQGACVSCTSVPG